MKRTLKKELKVLEIAEREPVRPSVALVNLPAGFRWVALAGFSQLAWVTPAGDRCRGGSVVQVRLGATCYIPRMRAVGVTEEVMGASPGVACW